MINDIQIYQGDLLDFDVLVTKKCGQPYELAEGEALWFCVTAPGGGAIISVTQAGTHFSFPEVTAPLGKYRAELGIIFENGEELTLIQSDLFISRRDKHD